MFIFFVLLSAAFPLAAARAITRYVARNNPAPVSPYTSWATAATSIQQAVDIAANNDLVLVTNGVYDTGGRPVDGTMTNRVVINKPLTVRSVNGPGATAIRGQGPRGDTAVRCVHVSAAVTLSGFLLTNGHTRTSGDLYSQQTGGGVYCGLGSSLTLTNCVLAGNAAQHYGGGSYYGRIVDCVYAGNSAASNGGGACYGILERCTLVRNAAAGDGGGAYFAGLNGCTLASNAAANGGGACAGTLDRCVLTGNSASGDGGGAYFGTLTACTLLGNSAFAGGGASEATLVNGLLWGNTATIGGGSILSTLTNCTLAGNSASSGGGARWGTMHNCISYFNSAPSGPNHDGLDAASYCCTTPLPGGAGNISDDPAFVDRAATNLRLLATSPCLDAGTNAAWMAGATDLDGHVRVANVLVDMGAYESTNLRLPYIRSHPASRTVNANDTVILSVTAVGTVPLFYQWWRNGAPFGGATNSSLSLINVQPSASGSYCAVVSNVAGRATSQVAVVTVLREPVITVQPAGQLVAAGGAATLTVAATGVAPLLYQWRRDGAPIPGATNAAFTLAGITTNDDRWYSAVVSNVHGLATSVSVRLTVMTVGDAVDASSLAWSAGGGAPWFWQTNTARDGADAARSGGISHSQESWMETSVNGPGTVTFWWKVSSESGGDGLEFWLGGARQGDRLTGEADWRPMSFRVPAGATALRWRYAKDYSDSGGQDGGWVDDMRFVPGPPVTDRDGDGIPDEWETAHGLDPAVSNAPNANADGDPFTDGQEYVADTDPTNAASFLRITALSLDAPPAAAFRFVSSLDRIYTLLLSTSLESAVWTPVPGQGPRAGLGGLDTLVDTNDTPQHRSRIYRLDVRMP